MRVSALFCLLLLFTSSPAPAATAPEYPLFLSPDGRTILDKVGSPVFFNADSPWHIITRLDQAETIQYLDDRAQRGFNSLLVSLLVDDDFNGTVVNRFGDAPFLSPGDFSAPNEPYFAHVDWFLQQAHARGLTVFITPAYLGWNCQIEGWCPEMKQSGAATLQDFGRWLGNRYASQPNIVWVNGGDADAAAHGALDEVEAVAQGILEVDLSHLHTAHCNRFSSAADCYESGWLDLNTTYADCTTTARELRNDYERSPLRPFVYVEGRYEFEFDWTDECLRSQAYWSFLGGATGHFYGSGKIWDFPVDWQTGLGSSGTSSMEHFFAMVQSRRWDLLVPDYAHTVLTGGYGDIDSDDYAAAARTSDGTTVIVYTPTSRPLTTAMDQISGTSAKAWWYDPANGQAELIGSYATSGSLTLTPPTSGDWVLVLDDESSNVCPPGESTAQCSPVAVLDPVVGASFDRIAPNPFGSRTRITYSAQRSGHVNVDVYDVRGRHVRALQAAEVPQGAHTLSWDGRDDQGRRAAAGVYRVVVHTHGSVQARSIVLFR